MPRTKISREEAVERIAEEFRRHGYAATSLSRIAEATGLGRASLYHHFPGGKDEMVRQVFRKVGEEVGEILALLEAPGDPRDRIIASMRAVERFYAGGAKNCLLGSIVLSGGSELFADELAAAFGAWIDTLSSTVRDAGVPAAIARRRAEDAVMRLQGALVVARGMKDTGLFRRMLAELPDQLLEESS